MLLSSSLIIGQFTLIILKLKTQDWFWWTKVCSVAHGLDGEKSALRSS